MIKKENHVIYYASLISVIVAGVFLMLFFSSDKNLQLLTLIGIGLSYVILGILHHFINHDLVLKIVIEYILIAALGLSISLFIIRGGFGF